MLAPAVLIYLGLVAVSADLGSCDLDLGHVAGRGVAGPVTINAADVHLAMLALLPLGNDLRPALTVTIDTLSIAGSRSFRLLVRGSWGFRLLARGRRCRVLLGQRKVGANG